MPFQHIIKHASSSQSKLVFAKVPDALENIKIDTIISGQRKRHCGGILKYQSHYLKNGKMYQRTKICTLDLQDKSLDLFTCINRQLN